MFGDNLRLFGNGLGCAMFDHVRLCWRRSVLSYFPYLLHALVCSLPAALVYFVDIEDFVLHFPELGLVAASFVFEVFFSKIE